ncbi:hypothetical protein SKAU_G00113640 [Synaphobranchus kaupii]|uniref:Uncharacterized protein n=1 Tax=Synaphobranchus kaupii TaxID=118154 RepID=A0A9Q1G0Z1_SYNKA|nr:hypothetical protein SKAU_G00113640 [Synaphobranchus kaupii]
MVAHSNSLPSDQEKKMKILNLICWSPERIQIETGERPAHGYRDERGNGKEKESMKQEEWTMSPFLFYPGGITVAVYCCHYTAGPKIINTGEERLSVDVGKTQLRERGSKR